MQGAPFAASRDLHATGCMYARSRRQLSARALQLVAKLALWGLSRQELPPKLAGDNCGAILRALLPALALDNRWQVCKACFADSRVADC